MKVCVILTVPISRNPLGLWDDDHHHDISLLLTLYSIISSHSENNATITPDITVVG